MGQIAKLNHTFNISHVSIYLKSPNNFNMCLPEFLSQDTDIQRIKYHYEVLISDCFSSSHDDLHLKLSKYRLLLVLYKPKH